MVARGAGSSLKVRSSLKRAPRAIARHGGLAGYERRVAGIMVGSAVRTARRRAGISQAELAKKAGTSQPSIARLEQGRVSPTVVSLDRIARALGTELVIDFEPLLVKKAPPA